MTVPESLQSLLRRVEALSPQRKKLFAERLEAHAREKLAFRSVPQGEAVPLTVGQKRMWELLEQHPELPINVVCQVVELRGDLDPVRLRAAVESFVARHRGLDTRVSSVNGELVQLPSSTPQISWRTDRLRGTGEPAAELDAMARGQARATGNGETGPLAIFTLVTVAERHHALVVTAQNLVIDAMSFSILLDEIGQFYGGVTHASGAPHQMVDAADWQRRWLDSAEYRQRLAHWKQVLGALDVTPMKPALPRPRERKFVGERINFDIAESTRARLAALCRENRATPFMGMAAVVLLFCAQQSQSRDVTIGTLATGRFRPELERIVGFLLHILPVHAQPRPEMSFVDLLTQVRSHVLSAQKHDGVPYEELSRELASPIFDLLFIYENIPPAEPFGDLTVSSRDVDKGCARFDLSLAIYEEPKRMHGWLEYDVSLYPRADVEAMIERFRGLLESVVRDPGKKVSP